MNKKIDKNKMVYFWKKIFSKIGCFILKKRTVLIFMIIFAMSGYCLFIWFRYVYKPEWDNSRKESYIREKEKGEIFEKNKFGEIISEFEKRELAREKKIEGINDIFKLK